MVLKKFLKNRFVAGICIAVLITLFCAVLNIAGVFQGLHLKFADSLYTRNAPSEEIVIIAIDEKSTQVGMDGLGPYTDWSRENYTKLLQELEKVSPKVIAFDILFHRRTTNIPITKIGEVFFNIPMDATDREKFEFFESFFEEYSDVLRVPIDREFGEKLGEFENIILATYAQDKIKPIDRFAQNAILGDANVIGTIDDDGVLRKIIPEANGYDNFSVAVVKEYLGKEEIDLKLDNGHLKVNYFADPFGYEMISFVDVIRGEVSEGELKDKIVLIGLTTFREIEDSNLTPRSNQIPMPGVEIWANAIQTILDGKFLVNQSMLGQILTVFFISAVLAIILSFSGIAVSVIVTLAAILLYLGAARIFYYQGVILNMVYPFLAIVLSYLAAWVYKYFIADREKNEIRSAFSHYVSDELVKEIAKNPEMVKLGGEKIPVTVFFSDIKGSTTLSEQTEITAWVEQINEYFTAMEKILKDNGGTLDKYEGDAIMAFWNAPLRQKDHAVRAMTTALTMKEKLKDLNEKWKSEGRPELEIRIGIFSGEALVGNFGSKDRFDYTVMGNTANTASRLESSANKTYGTNITVAGFEDYTDAGELRKFIFRELDMALLPGKKEPVKIFELVDVAEKDVPGDVSSHKQQSGPEKATIQKTIFTYEQGLVAYQKKNWDKAIKFFESLPEDPPAQTMLKRCLDLKDGKEVPNLRDDMVLRIDQK